MSKDVAESKGVIDFLEMLLKRKEIPQEPSAF
jgi:hypothetical protein